MQQLNSDSAFQVFIVLMDINMDLEWHTQVKWSSQTRWFFVGLKSGGNSKTRIHSDRVNVSSGKRNLDFPLPVSDRLLPFWHNFTMQVGITATQNEFS